MEKLYIKSEDLLKDSFHLAWKVYESGFKPNYIIGVWRGGAPVGIAVQEFLDVLNVPSDHIAIRTSHYKSMNERDSSVQVYGSVESACDDLLTTKKKLTQIANDNGFYDQSSFTQHFRKQMKITPLKYRKQKGFS